eukprot:scaffold61898_cov72-Phaeocystis_antarctica.AAC.6
MKSTLARSEPSAKDQAAGCVEEEDLGLPGHNPSLNHLLIEGCIAHQTTTEALFLSRVVAAEDPARELITSLHVLCQAACPTVDRVPHSSFLAKQQLRVSNPCKAEKLLFCGQTVHPCVLRQLLGHRVVHAVVPCSCHLERHCQPFHTAFAERVPGRHDHGIKLATSPGAQVPKSKFGALIVVMLAPAQAALVGPCACH